MTLRAVVTLRAFLCLSALLAPLALADAQEHHSPYAQEGSARVKTLSQAEVDELLAGAGMGMARPAELNGFPGPRHVLDLADSLALTPEQRAGVEEIFRRMNGPAVEIGGRIVAEEAKLDSLFAGGAVDEATLADRLRAIEALRADLRLAHLRAHLETKALLTVHQVHTYDRLRGYGGAHVHDGD